MQRKLAAILAADVVGYSRLMRADEVGTLAAMKALWSEVVQPSVRSHRGRVFKLMGDGMLAEFASVVDAANAADAIQTAANERAGGQAEDKAIRLRIGINLGDVVVDGSDLYGDGVNIAARLQEVAEPGGIALSAGTHDYLRGKSTLTFADAGERSLKNIDEPVRVWLWPEVSQTGGGVAPAGVGLSGAQAAPSRSSQPSIAVLPFQNLSSDPDAEFFADGMTDDVIDAISKFRWLTVIARGTMFSYKSKSFTDAQVAQELNVRYVLEGSVRQTGQRMRLSAQLTDSKTGGSIWSQRFDRQADDIFAIQDDITNAIVAAIAPEIDRAERTGASARQQRDLDGWLRYQQGLAAYYKQTEDGFDQAIDDFRYTQTINPQFAPAFAMEAMSRATIALNFRFDISDGEKSDLVDLAGKAITLDPRDPLCWLSSSRAHSVLRQHENCVPLLDKAVSLNPNFATAWFWRANTLWRVDRLNEAYESIEKAIALSPFDPSMSIFLYNRGVIFLSMGEYKKAIESVDQGLILGTVRTWANINRIAGYWYLGDHTTAAKYLNNIRIENPNITVRYLLDAAAADDAIWTRLTLHVLRELGVPEE